MPKLHIRCIAGLELAFSVAGFIEDRDTSDKCAEAAILTPQKSSRKKRLMPKLQGVWPQIPTNTKCLGGLLATTSKQETVLEGALKAK